MSTYSAVSLAVKDLGLAAQTDQVDDVQRVLNTSIDYGTFDLLSRRVKNLGVGDELQKVVAYFKTPSGETPAGFRRVMRLAGDTLIVDLERDISRDTNGAKRPTKTLYSADSANPYEVEPIAPFIANLTCNPGIIYDLFLNNPEANVGNKYKDRDEVMTALGDVLGPGCDISVELNNPFNPNFDEILEEAERFREILSPWRVVIKVPHTGPVTADNYRQLLTGNGQLDVAYDKGSTADMLRGHRLALKLHEHGFRVNFTLMFEPYQAQLALQARPAFINSFIRHRKLQSERITNLLAAYESSGEAHVVDELRSYLIANDYLPAGSENVSEKDVLAKANDVQRHRGGRDGEPADGLDNVRHNLRALRQANLPDTRLIICSMEGPDMYPEIDRLLTEPEFEDMAGRIVITTEPQYLARFTSTNQVVSYQRRFMKAADGAS
ncbi:transaldolase family protein [Flaviflexus huanghaiensis]|uniref:transaldolase family protein n=1 Tax=Flaviflexus huanghaiensis TaxID=1111473 RepID=UPI0015FA70A6|nr:transaldolase family protein [Flaviflexus huanghaiensis]